MANSNNSLKLLPGKNVYLFLMAIALGGAGFYYSKKYIEDQVSYYKGQLEKTETMVEIVVPTRALKRGDTIYSNDLSVRAIPEKYADSNSVTGNTYETALGQRLDFDIDEGRPLLWAHLEGGLTPTFSGKVGDGLRAMTVRVDEINSISGFLQPNDKVDLMLSHGTGRSYQIFPLIQNLDVIATGVQTFVDKSALGATRPFSTITVHVSPIDGQKITLAQQVGKLTALLRNPEDQTPLDEQPLTVAELLNKPVDEVTKPMVTTQRKKPTVQKPAVEYIIGGQ